LCARLGEAVASDAKLKDRHLATFIGFATERKNFLEVAKVLIAESVQAFARERELDVDCVELLFYGGKRASRAPGIGARRRLECLTNGNALAPMK